MAGLRFSLNTGNVSLLISTTRTLWQVLPASNTRVRLERLRIFGQGVLSTDTPVQFDLLLQTTAGTSSAIVVQNALPCLQKIVDFTETFQTAALGGFSSTEPTSGAVKMSFNVHPQGNVELVFPPGRDFYIPAGVRLALRVVTPAQACVFNAIAEFEE